jgi:hypothetical protein
MKKGLYASSAINHYEVLQNLKVERSQRWKSGVKSVLDVKYARGTQNTKRGRCMAYVTMIQSLL